MVQGIIQTSFGDKFHDTLSMTECMNACVAYLSSSAKIILHVLPSTTRRQVLHNQSVIRPRSWWVASMITSTVAASATKTSATTTSSKSSAAAAASAITVAVTWITSKFDTYPISQQILSIKIMGNIISVARIVELHETVALTLVFRDIFNYNFADTSVSFEKFLQVAITSIARNISDENPSSRHFDF